MIVPLALAPSSGLHLSAWVVPFNPVSVETFVRQAAKVHQIMPQRFEVSADGTVIENKLWLPGEWEKVSSAAKKNDVAIFAMVNNYVEPDGFDSKRMSLMLRDKAVRAKAIGTLVGVTVREKLAGIDLDFESLVAEDRAVFSQFVSELAASLHTKKKQLSVTVHPKDKEPGNWFGPQAQDWRAIGKSADQVKIMCYDVHWSTSEAGPIAPTEWVVRVAKFALSQIPKDKVDIGVAWYGYNWNSKPATSLVYGDVPRMPFTQDASSGELMQGQNLYFSGRAAFEQKVKALRALGLTKVSAWYCGSEEPDLWRLIPIRAR